MRSHSLVSYSSFFSTRVGALVLSLMLVLSTTLTGCVPGADQRPVVTINKTIVVTRGDYEALHSNLIAEAHLDPKQFNESSPQQGVLNEQIKQAVLNKLIFSALLKDSAKKQGVTVTEEQYQHFRKKQIEPLGGEEGLKQVLASKNMTLKTFEDSLREQLLMEAFFDAQPGSKTKISEAEAKAFYQSHPELFKHPEGLDMAHILLKVDPTAIRTELLKGNPNVSDADIVQRIDSLRKLKADKAHEILKTVQDNPKAFGSLAKATSQDVLSAVKNGELGVMYADTTVPAFWVAAKATPAGTIHSKVVETPFGFHILKVNKSVPAGIESFDKIKDNIVRVLSQQRRQQAMMAWMESQRKGLQLHFEKGFVPMGFRQPEGAEVAQPYEHK
ncbi:MAG: peptidylprolyl isomerase [Vampirovibrionales bacterium]|nr:peptidylprolyl isomerase [Vampirovibrionales bacterium]